jgi:glycosyltransferase involved in cell wall biosynthesis
MDQIADNQSCTNTKTTSIIISIVVPAYNEEEVLPEFHKRISDVLDSLSINTEIVYVNDGSVDNTLTLLNELQKKDYRVSIVDLSRNFGKEIAMTAGIDLAQGDAVIVIDADLQDPPELIPELVKHWNEGYDVVYAQRIVREGESLIKKVTAHAFYNLMQKISHIKIPEDAGDFRLLSNRAVESLKQMPEQHRFMKGLFTWIGYKQKPVPYRRDPRFAGNTKWNYWRLWNFALEGITSFTIMPLKIATYFGLVTAIGAFTYGTFIIARTLVYGNPVPGYPSLLIVILFLGGIQLVTLGIIGEYLGRVFNESKRRPLYFLKSHTPSKPHRFNS